MLYFFALPVGTPLSVAVPLLPTLKDTSGGRVPDSESATDEDASEVVTVKESDWFSGKVVEVGDVNSSTDKVACWVTANPTPFEAPNVMGYTPPEPAGGLPDTVAEPPAAAGVNVAQLGSPEAVIVGLGFPTAVTLKLSFWPTPTVRLFEEVMRGADAVGVTGLSEAVAAGPVPPELIGGAVMS